MSLFDWSTSYELGVDFIDTQHKKIFSILNDIINAQSRNANRAEIEEIIDDLIFYTKIHFNQEEKEMEDDKFPEVMEHRALHQEFTSKITKFREDFKNGVANIEMTVLEEWKAWLLNHVSVDDKKYTVK